jgi:mono/diheme cytochrome c family protein
MSVLSQAKWLRFAVPPILGLAALVLLFLLLARFAAYHSPLRGREPAWMPRAEALEQIAARERERAEEAARLAELKASLDTAKMVELGRDIVLDKGLCLSCHTVEGEGFAELGPALDGVGARAATRVEGESDVDYLAESLYAPEAYVVEGYAPLMTPANEDPVNLDDMEILMVVAYLQSLGGTPTVTPETVLRH